MAGQVELSINGLTVKAEEGMTVLEAALKQGIYIPHLCHHPDLEPVGACRLCLVQINGSKPVISCKTRVRQGMVVLTETPEIQKLRQVIVELLVADHDADCLLCRQNTKCELQRVVDHVGVNQERLARLKPARERQPIDTSNPFFNFDPNRCVMCGICVRTCDELQNVQAIDFIQRGIGAKVAGFGDKPRIESTCESCGECVVRCPVGALVEKDAELPTHYVRSICGYCGCGCGLLLGVRGQRIVTVRGDSQNAASQGRLCVKGRFGFRYINHADRLKKPLVRRDGEFVEVDWDEALALIAEKLAGYKGDRFAAIASAKCTNEENYVLQKFTRTVMQTNNIDHCARL